MDHRPPTRGTRKRGTNGRYAVLREARNIRAFNLSDGRIRWQLLAPKPVASLNIVGGLVLIGGDRLIVLSLDSGEERWQAALSGALRDEVGAFGARRGGE